MRTILLKTILVLSLVFGLQTSVKAQLVYIPDSAFRAFLYFNSSLNVCLVGDSIDPTCPAVLNTKAIDVSNRGIYDLTGIEVFVNDTTLTCSYNALTSIPLLPSTLKYLYCRNNQLTSLPALPSSLLKLDCRYNQLTSLPTLPSDLIELNCDINQLTSLPNLPSSLKRLECAGNQLTSLPSLPDSLILLSCYVNQLTSLPILPSTLTDLSFSGNQLISFPNLPSSLKWLSCNDIQLTSLPALLPSLFVLNCQQNQLTVLPPLPASLKKLKCGNNQLTVLPQLPDSLNTLHCENNPLTCFPDLKNVTALYFSNTLVNCVPNYGNVVYCIPSIEVLPICDIFNSNSCDVLWNIEGTTYFDFNKNCIIDSNESGYTNQKVRLYKNGILDQLTYTRINGNYNFNTFSYDNYRTEIDTNGIPFEINCPISGFYLDTISAIDSIKYDRDFPFKCKGVDLAATSIDAENLRPASIRTINIEAGDFSSFYSANCATGVCGTVSITITGPCNYISSPSYALTPNSVSGNVLTYNITDFGALSYNSTFDFNLLVDTTAALGSQICITVNVYTKCVQEINYTNNQLTQCFTVVGSFDPNDKSVSPTTTMDLSGNRWLTYTIRFQNTGTASAEHILITDTLSNDLILSTFTLLSSSHDPIVELKLDNDRVLKFQFPHINLPDSNTNEPASHGYVQYKIQAKNSLVIGNTIENTANIYFDFNAPVITNTTSNTVIDCNIPSTNLIASLCDGEVYSLNGMEYYSTGKYKQNLLTAFGCDSIVRLNLTVNKSNITQSNNTLQATTQNAISYQWINCTTGTAIVGANTQTYNPTQSGDYAVVVDFGTCKDTSTCYNFQAAAILVYIPDSAFRAYLNQNFSSCMVGDSIDPTCPAVLNTSTVNVGFNVISDLTGIEVFVNLDSLFCFNNSLSSLPQLPSGLKSLVCSNNALTTIGNLPNTLENLYCQKNLLTSLSSLPDSLKILDCHENDLTSLPTIPTSLTNLYCDYNQLTSLPSLPNTITEITCYYNQLSSLPALPSSLINLYCNNNNLTSLPSLPSKLERLSCHYNQLTSLPALPDSLARLICAYNQIGSLPALPSSLDLLTCSYNQLTNLPLLPDSLTQLFCDSNQLNNLPTLPQSLSILSCYDNQLASLPELSNSLATLICYNNQLVSLPLLPDSLQALNCADNPITCLPDLNQITNLNFSNTLVDCVPNYGIVSFSNPPLLSLPICDLFNSNGCDVFWNIEGATYVDIDSNCINGSNEKGYSNQKINLYKNGVLDQQTYTRFNGNYEFNTTAFDFYKTEIDTLGLPLNINCPSNGFYLDTISVVDSIKYDRNFALKCKGIDLATTSIYSENLRPASLTTVNIFAGDITNFYGLNCSVGTSGTVTISITGACNYVSSPSYALTPTTAIGNVLTYSIADFGAISYDSTFDFNLLVDTTAALGSQICITVSVSTANAELNYNNNQLTQCFTVVGSFDPNDKAVYPTTTLDISGNKWLNYTIRFQNTGTAEAEHIFITDTLSSLLDKSTFTLLSYSHEPFVQLYNDGLLKFNFPNINLPDSNSNEPESHGYVQYKIRAKDSLTVGSTIENTANIFFDFNAPVITNTVRNTVINCSLLQATIAQSAGTLEANLANANYQWINCATGATIVGANTQTFNPSQSGSYAVVVDFGTCKDTSACFYFSPVGINEINASNISVQPNPFNSELKITLDKNYNGVIEVYNTIGEIITSEKLQSRNITLNTNNWNVGVYILKVATNDGVIVKKVIKR